MLSPYSYTNVVSHNLRKNILHKLFALSIDIPVTKQQLAEALGLKYEKVNYQLNEHLREFWKVKHREKVRGTYREYIGPEISNTIYLNIDLNKTLYVIDPLANLIGKLKDIGTRCDRCSMKIRGKCLNELEDNKCLPISKKERVRREKALEANNRKRPFTPIDYMIVCTLANSLDSEPCMIKFTSCGCPFIEKLREETVALQRTN